MYTGVCLSFSSGWHFYLSFCSTILICRFGIKNSWYTWKCLPLNVEQVKMWFLSLKQKLLRPCFCMRGVFLKEKKTTNISWFRYLERVTNFTMTTNARRFPGYSSSNQQQIDHNLFHILCGIYLNSENLNIRRLHSLYYT